MIKTKLGKLHIYNSKLFTAENSKNRHKEFHSYKKNCSLRAFTMYRLESVINQSITSPIFYKIIVSRNYVSFLWQEL
jgi:hypothetical protein